MHFRLLIFLLFLSLCHIKPGLSQSIESGKNWELVKHNRILLDSISNLVGVMPDKARVLCNKAYQQAVLTNDSSSMSEALRMNAIAFHGLNQKDVAYQKIEQAKHIAKNIPCQQARVLLTYANFIRLDGEPERSARLFEQSATRLAHCGHLIDLMQNLYFLGLSYEMSGRDKESVLVLDALLKIAKSRSDFYYQFKAANSMLIVFLKTGKNPLSLFELMRKAAEKSGDPDLEVSAWNNMAKYYTSVNDDVTALHCYEKALAIAFNAGDDENIALVSINISMYYLRKFQYDRAYEFFRNAVSRQQYIVHFKWKSIFLEMKAKFEVHEGKTQEAIQSVTEAIRLLEAAQDFQQLFNLKRFAANIHLQAGNFQQASALLSQSIDLQDSIIAKRQNDEENNLYYKVLLDLEKEKANSMILKNENLEKSRNILYLLFGSAFILLLFGGAVFYFLSNRFRNRIISAEQQKETLLAARIRLSDELQAKNKEIASFVLNQAMVHEQSNEAIVQLRQIGMKCPKDVQKKLFEIAGMLSGTQNKNIWKEFDHYFRQVNPNFFTMLVKQHKDLTSRDLRYCALLSLQLSSKEMSMITGMTLQSIHVLRSRLRQKLNVEKDEDLGVYLSRLSELEDDSLNHL